MAETRNGSEFLEYLRKQNGKQRQTFDAFYSYLEKKARIQGVPLSGEFELTPMCNLNCKMCYVHLSPEQMNNRELLTVEQWKDLMHQAYKAGMLHATLTGGECLTYPGFRELFLYLHSLGCEVSVFTNGVLLNQDWIDFFKQHAPSEIQITLYGANEEIYQRVTGSRVFSRVIENIHFLKEADLPVRLCITPSRYLGEDVFETVHTAYNLYHNVTINSNLFKPKEETGRSEQKDDPDTEMYIRIFQYLASLSGRDLKTIEETQLPEPGNPVKPVRDDYPDCKSSERDKSSVIDIKNSCDACGQPLAHNVYGLLCGGGRSSFTIDWKGAMIPCSMMDMIKAEPLRDGFISAWQKINSAANSWPRPVECENCEYRSVCNNCAAYMLQFAGPGERPVQLCNSTKKLVSAGLLNISDCV